jgi:phosphatidylglycerol:prolipoprotein diacylglycerol transferase
MSGVALDLGIIQIHWYGIFYVISFLVSYFYILWILKRFNKNLFKLPISDDKISEFLLDFLFYVVLGVLIGGRLGHVVIYHLNYYLQHPLEVFYVWQGGMSFL